MNNDSTVPDGTLTVNGDLEDGGSLTLDVYLDPTAHSSNKLFVTGSASIGGSIAFYTPADTDSDAFSAGQSYTVLEAGTLSGTFSNLAAGLQPVPSLDGSTTPVLPILPVGLRWLATYSSTSLVLSVISIAKATDLYAYSNPDFLTYTTTQPVTFNWTNHDPGIVSSYIEVKEGDGSNSEGNYFTVGHVDGNIDTFSFGADDLGWSFQTGVTYTFRVRTITAAGAAYSDPYTFTVTDFSSDPDLSITDSVSNPYGDGTLLDLIDGADSDFGYSIIGKSSSGPFPDRWVPVQSSDTIDGNLAYYPAGVNADSLYLLEQQFTYDEDGNPTAQPFTATAIPDPAGYSLEKPSVSAAFGPDGILISWGAVSGAYEYYIIDESQIEADHFIWETSTTSTSKLITYDSLFAPHEFHRNDFFAVMAVSSTGDLSAASTYIDAEPAATTTILMTTVSDKAVRLTWDNNSFNEDGCRILRSDDGGSTYAQIGTADADEAEYTDTTAVLGHAYKYEVVAYRNVGAGYLDSAASGATASVKLAPRFAALTAPPMVNDGSPSRSMVTSVTLTFNQAVTLGTGAVTITQEQADGSDPVAMPIAVNNPSGDGVTWVVTFTDPMYVNGSLPDGTYALTLNTAAVTSNLTGQTGVEDQTMTFFRVYGDVSGDGTVDGTDVSIVEYGTGTAGDVNGDGVVDFTDWVDVWETQGDHV
ncbi:MAG TPA: hypothetical protein VHQ47_03640 [Phycisphaerae bacterium]|nr:hypothetical protein [Phycisphaerae bacterium]